MKLQIKGECDKTSIKIDGVELSGITSKFRLVQEAGCPAELVMTIPVLGEMDVEIPDGVIVIEKELRDSSLAASRGVGASEAD